MIKNKAYFGLAATVHTTPPFGQKIDLGELQGFLLGMQRVYKEGSYIDPMYLKKPMTFYKEKQKAIGRISTYFKLLVSTQVAKNTTFSKLNPILLEFGLDEDYSSSPLVLPGEEEVRVIYSGNLVYLLKVEILISKRIREMECI